MRLIFDFDGTLVNSMPALAVAAVGLLRDYDLDAEDAEFRYLATVGRAFPEQLQMLFPEHSRNAYAARMFRSRQQEIYTEVGLFPGVKRLLKDARMRGHEVFVCSSTERSLVAPTLQRLLGESSGISAVWGRENGTKYQQLKVLTTPRTWFIADAPYDAELAKKVGCKFIAVTHTFPREDFPVDTNIVAKKIGAIRLPLLRNL